MKKSLLFITSCLLLSGSMHSQVTIGSGEKPNSGALLDLKDETAKTAPVGGETSKKGLGLPRVELKNLKPTNPTELAASIGATGTWNEAEHIGLLVYNAKANGSICPGLHVWDGTTWVALGGNAGGAKPDITMTDGDGNVYAAKWFSADPCDPAAAGAYWTTSNLYTTKDKNGVAFTGGARLNPGKYGTGGSAITINSTGDFTGNTVAYGQSATTITATNQTPPMKDYAVKFGLSYTHAQAMLACPASWSLPDDAAWDALALAHGGASVAGAAMRANNDYFLANDNSTTSYKWGQSETAALSGFNALPSGRVRAAGAGTFVFSSVAYWWSASTSGSCRFVNYTNSGLNANTGGTGFYLSVRCVKN